MPAAQGVSNFVNRNNANPFDEKNARYSPSARGSSQARQSNNNSSLSHAERQRIAAGARMPVPATRLKAEPDTDMKGLATVVANRPASVISNIGPEPRNVFDDTDLDDTISSGLRTLEGEEHYVTFKTDYDRPSHERLKDVNTRHYGQPHGGYNIDDNKFQLEGILTKNWKEIVKTEKALQAGLSRPSSVADEFDDDHQMYLQEGQEYDDQEDIETHDQGGEDDIEGQQHHIDDAEYHHDEKAPEPTPSRSRSNQMLPPPPPPQMKVTSTFTTSSAAASKSSSFVEASEDEMPPNQPVAKRARLELDYDPHVLKTMSYTDLDKQPFEKDPRATNTTPPVDEHGIPLTLHRRLGNLSRMKEEDVRAMFSSQKDQEWENTGAWFMGQFETQMRRLMEIRQERRMIALKYEMEVKKRQAAVAAKTGDVEQELRYLKTGGRELMDKRVSPMK